MLFKNHSILISILVFQTFQCNIKIGDLMKAIPFENYLGKVTLKGSEIWEAFEFSFRRYDGITSRGEFLQVSGLKVVIDLSQPSGKRVKSIYVRCGNCIVIDYQKLNLNAYYTVIMSQFLFEGGDGFAFNKSNNKFLSLGKTDLQIIKEEIALKSPISPEVDQRIVLVNNQHYMLTPLSDLTILLTVLISLLAIILFLTIRHILSL